MKKLISRLLKKSKDAFTNVKDLKKCILCFVLTFFSACVLLFSGTKNATFNTYCSASYYANIVKNNEDIKNVGIVVKQKNQNSIMPDTATELRSLYGAFGNRKSNYAGTINAEKKHSITFKDFDIGNNFSFVYIQTGVGVNKSKVNPTHYRMEFYPLDLMFEYYGNNPTKYYSFMYISTEQARTIIDIKYPGMFDNSIPTNELANDQAFINKCKGEILGKELRICFDGTIKNFQVTNIFYAEDYFFNTVYNTIGNFIVGYNQYPDGFQKEATYFMNEYEYQNNFYINYLKERYCDGNYDFGLVNKNFESEFDYSKGFSFLDKQNDVLFILLLILSILLFVSSLALMFWHRLFNLTYSIYSLLSLIIPHLIGSMLYFITKNLSFFSPFYSTTSLVIILSLSVIYIFFLVIRKYKRKDNFNE